MGSPHGSLGVHDTSDLSFSCTIRKNSPNGSLQANKALDTGAISISLQSGKRLEINLTHTFIELALTSARLWSQQGDEMLRTSRGTNAPFLIRNRTGHDIRIWPEADNAKSAANGTQLADGKDIPWRLDDWRTMRESATTAVVHNALSFIIQDSPWERVRHVSLEREGEQTYRLRPKIDKVTHRLLCEVKLVNNVKVVTLRSTLKIENLTMVPSEMVMVESDGKKTGAVYKIREAQYSVGCVPPLTMKPAPGGECSVPIEAAYHKRIKLRPDREQP